MSGITRREVIVGVATAAACLAMPAAAVVVPPESVAANIPAWAVGTSGEWDWDVIEAATEHEAKLAWISEKVGGDVSCEIGGELNSECQCETCAAFFSIDANRKPEWDGKNVQAGSAAWFASGLGAYCDRCGYEATWDGGGRVVDRDVVCEDCMTLADWDIVDPERAAEMREEEALT